MVGTRRTGAQDLHRQPKHPRQQSEQTIPGQHENQNRVLVAVERLSARLTRLKEQRGGGRRCIPLAPQAKEPGQGVQDNIGKPTESGEGEQHSVDSVLLLLQELQGRWLESKCPSASASAAVAQNQGPVGKVASSATSSGSRRMEAKCMPGYGRWPAWHGRTLACGQMLAWWESISMLKSQLLWGCIYILLSNKILGLGNLWTFYPFYFGHWSPSLGYKGAVAV